MRMIGSGGSHYALEGLTSRVSPDGRYFAFMSDRELTGYDNHDANSGAADEEVFLYHARKTSGRNLAAWSARRVIRRARGRWVYSMKGLSFRARVFTLSWLSTGPRFGKVAGWRRTSRDGHRRDVGEAFYQSRYLSDSGRLFFNSSDALVPQDVNGTEDVYEYEPKATGRKTRVVGRCGEWQCRVQARSHVRS